MRFTACICFAFLSYTMLSGCSRGNVEVPGTSAIVSADSLISPERMILIMTDVHTVEAALLLERNNPVKSNEPADYYYQGIFRKYHISSGRYEQNLNYYLQNPEEYAKMYAKVTTILETRQKQFAKEDKVE